MADLLKVACIQLNSTPDIQKNLERCADLVRQAARLGAEFIVTPENTCNIRCPAEEKMRTALTEEEHAGIPFFAALAKELNITLLIGSMAIKGEAGKLWNRAYLFAADGTVKATYNKIHLFDVELPSGEMHKESDIYECGEDAVVAQIEDDCSIGLSICYDIRFPHLFRDLAKDGANIMCVPAAFTVSTGKAHWETLLRARAIETGSYVLAAAQVGEHEGGRKTYGHSMIINPWGEVVEVQASGEGFIISDLDLQKVGSARAAIPSLTHDRIYEVKKHE